MRNVVLGMRNVFVIPHSALNTPHSERACSSVGQSMRLISAGSVVQLHARPPFFSRSEKNAAPKRSEGGPATCINEFRRSLRFGAKTLEPEAPAPFFDNCT